MHDVTTPYDLYIDLMDSAVYPYVNGIPGTKFIELYQNEAKASIFNIHISKNYEFLDLKDKTVRIGFKKPDDEIVWQPCTIVDAAKGKVQVVLEEQTLAVAGEIRAQVQVSDAENRSAESAVFYLYVHESVITKKAIQSTSAAPLLEDAIKAGELFKDYNVSDLAAIKPTAEAAQVSAEKAKTTADGALPKTGGTMTGTLTSGSVYPIDFKGAKGQPNWTLRHLSSDGSLVFAPSKTPEGTDWDWTKQIVLHPVKGFQVSGDTNLLKNTGGDVNGDLRFSNGRLIRLQNPENKTVLSLGADSNGGIYSWSDVASKGIFTYSPETHFFNMQADSNLLKTTGGVVSGELTMRGALARLVFDVAAQSVTFDQPTTQISARGLLYREDGVTTGGLGRLRDTSGSYSYMGWGANPWDMSTALVVNDKIFKYKNKDVAMRDKDGRATLTLTENATQYGSTYTPVATRRGNAVTLRMVISRNGNDNGVITTLPADMRPVDGVTSTIVASDGTSSDVVIRLNGEVEILTKNKTYRILLTYVVD